MRARPDASVVSGRTRSVPPSFVSGRATRPLHTPYDYDNRQHDTSCRHTDLSMLSNARELPSQSNLANPRFFPRNRSFLGFNLAWHTHCSLIGTVRRLVEASIDDKEGESIPGGRTFSSDEALGKSNENVKYQTTTPAAMAGMDLGMLPRYRPLFGRRPSATPARSPAGTT